MASTLRRTWCSSLPFLNSTPVDKVQFARARRRRRPRSMPERLALVACTGQIEGLAQDQRRGAHGPGFIPPALHLDVKLRCHVREGLISHWAHDGVDERGT